VIVYKQLWGLAQLGRKVTVVVILPNLVTSIPVLLPYQGHAPGFIEAERLNGGEVSKGVVVKRRAALA
jgi:hypothetical protein